MDQFLQLSHVRFALFVSRSFAAVKPQLERALLVDPLNTLFDQKLDSFEIGIFVRTVAAKKVVTGGDLLAEVLVDVVF